MVREIVTDWTTNAGSGFVTVTFWDHGFAVASQRSAWAAFLGSVDALLAGAASWTIRTDGRDLEDASGALLAAWSDSTPFTGSGGATGTSSGADAAQALVRWQTGVVVGGRFLQGRTFLPAVGSASIVSGNLTSASQTTIGNAAATLIGTGTGFGVWHRPVLGAGGDFVEASGGSAWSELAVLRRRRG
jgi:hypothetical protein